MDLSTAPESVSAACVDSAFAGTIPAEADEALRYFLSHCRAEATFTNLDGIWKRIVLPMCYRWNRVPLPMEPIVAGAMVARLAWDGYAWGYIRNVASTIASAHYFARLPSPTRDPGFRETLAGIARTIGTASTHQKAALFTPELRAIGEELLAEGTLKARQEWTILDLTFYSALRRESLISLNGESFVDGPSLLLHFYKSKTNQFGRRVELVIDPIPEDPILCPVTTTRAWLDRIDWRGPLFRHMRAGVLSGERLSERTVARIVQRGVARLGLDPAEYGAQSLRSGFITESLLKNVPPTEVARQTLHEDLDSLLDYFRPGSKRLNLSRAVTYGP